MNKLLHLLALALLVVSCTNNCCEDGTTIDQDEAITIINNNDLNDPLFSARIEGEMVCSESDYIAQTNLAATNEFGFAFETQMSTDGSFALGTLFAGQYTLRFDNPILPTYTTEEYETIIARINEIVLGMDTATDIEELAFNVVNFEDGITSFDMLIFMKLKDGEMTVDEIPFPWRFIIEDSIGTTTEISDSLSIVLAEEAVLDLLVRPIYIGDNQGKFCN